MDVVTGLIPNLNAAFKELDAFFDNVLAQHKAAKRNEDDDHHKSEKKGFVDILHQLQQDGLLEFQLSHSDLKALLLVSLFFSKLHSVFIISLCWYISSLH